VVAKLPVRRLLLTGRPSRLPGIQRSLQVLPLPGRISGIAKLRTGGWYPFHRTAGSTTEKAPRRGAMLGLLCANHSGDFTPCVGAQAVVAVKHSANRLQRDQDADVLYRDIQSEDYKNQLPEIGDGRLRWTRHKLEMRGDLRLGVRQLADDRWALARIPCGSTKAGREVLRALGGKRQAPLIKVRFEVKPADKYTASRIGQRPPLGSQNRIPNCNNVNFNPQRPEAGNSTPCLDAGPERDPSTARQCEV